jgi:hypothetical protein
MHKVCVCLDCEAEFTIRHDMGDDHYQVTYCPFCGEELDVEEEYDFDDEEEE